MNEQKSFNFHDCAICHKRPDASMLCVNSNLTLCESCANKYPLWWQRIALANKTFFSAEFLEWIPENTKIIKAFCEEALRVITAGRTHYSSYTIVEFLRHHSAVAEKGGEWKINNNYRPYLPRLFDLMYPDKAGLFEYRVTTKPAEKA